MPIYKNIGLSDKTFYGVKIKSGQQKKVPGSINDSYFVLVELEESSEVSNKRTRKSRSINKVDSLVSEGAKDEVTSGHPEVSKDDTKEKEVKTGADSSLEIPA